MFDTIRNFFRPGTGTGIVELAQAGDNSDWKPSLTQNEVKAKRKARKRDKAARQARKRNRRK